MNTGGIIPWIRFERNRHAVEISYEMKITWLRIAFDASITRPARYSRTLGRR